MKTKAALGSDVREMGYIYLITNTVNRKRYVGQTQREDIEKRWKEHKTCSKFSIGRCLLAAYNKYGIEHFKFQIICICFDDACNLLEVEYIKKFNTLVPNGYNLKEGGLSSRCHPDTKKLLSQVLKGRVTCPRTPEIQAKMTATLHSRPNPNLGKLITDDRRDKLSKSMKKVWDKRREDGTLDKYKKNNTTLFGMKGGVSPNRKCVGKYDKEGNLLDTYSSTVEAGLAVGIGRTAIGAVCRGVKSQKTAAGFVWKFLSNDKIAS